MMKKLVAPCVSFLISAAPAAAWAQTAPEAAPAPEANAPKPAPAPYSLPWMMRGVVPGNVVRLDTVFAFSKPRTTVPVLLFGSYKILPNLAAIVRLGVIHNRAEDPKVGSGTAFVNPALGVMYGLPLGASVKASFFAATTIPVGMGGGDTPNAAARSANLPSGIFARASMDNALFQINYLTPMVGADIAYIANGFTVQLEATLLELIRVRGAAVDKDAARTNLTAGLHAGYFPIPQLSIGAELRYQYWIAHETIEKGPDPSAVDHWTLGFGPRAHFKIGEKMWLRPGVSLTMGLDLPTGFSAGGQEYKIVQVDVPFAF
ncbi:hypothetical protein [Polyangium aurulentum]|uniref:hypothetical protein n=1 Tax=Polyangium aurulentum TaxID=2567896 RepID=UPI00197DB87E|nr:hypothetical protein [Polyangium aurulentum]UQA54928.1 hypothetical protein E8A73_026580 [Polyangium aurulentum]